MDVQENHDSGNHQQDETKDLPVNEEQAVEVKGGLDPGKAIRFKAGKDLHIG